LRYYRSKQNLIYPRNTFRADLVNFLNEYIQEGYGIILSIDANENIRGGKLQRELELIRLVESSALFSNKPPWPSYVLG